MNSSNGTSTTTTKQKSEALQSHIKVIIVLLLNYYRGFNLIVEILVFSSFLMEMIIDLKLFINHIIYACHDQIINIIYS